MNFLTFITDIHIFTECIKSLISDVFTAELINFQLEFLISLRSYHEKINTEIMFIFLSESLMNEVKNLFPVALMIKLHIIALTNV